MTEDKKFPSRQDLGVNAPRANNRAAEPFPQGASGRHPKVFIKTFGCQMNVADSEWMRSILTGAGWQIANSEAEADAVLLNTCSVRARAEEKVWSKLGRLGIARQEGRNLIVGVCGCMAQNYGQKIFDRAPYVNLVCGSYRFSEINKLLTKVRQGTTHILDIERKDESTPGESRHLKKTHVTSFVPVMRGCNNMCSYCMVPFVRGPERSRPKNEILAEIKQLAQQGYKEITLLGQNVNSYRSINGQEETRFADLLREVNEIAAIARIRFVTSHPRDAGTDLFRAMGELDKVCPSLHLPVQSGSSRILAAMNRGYTREHYLDLIKQVRELVPGIALHTDIIVGFPGETEEDFQQTYRLMEEVQYDGAFIFKYSPRPGTAAERLKDDVPLNVKKQRNKLLLELQGSISHKKNKLLIGKSLEVLVEGGSKNNKNRLMGRTRTNKIIVWPAPYGKELTGNLVNIRIVDVTPYTLFGELCN